MNRRSVNPICVHEVGIDDPKVVIATCHSSSGRPLRNQDFDVVIIDEATQALEAVSGHI